MNEFKSKFEYWSKKLNQFDALLMPILDTPYVEGSSHEEIKIEIEKFGISEEANAIVKEIMVDFPKVSESQRLEISSLIDKNDSVLWALDPTDDLMTAKDLENELLWFIIRDQGKDTRDAMVELNEIANNSRKLGLDAAAVFTKLLPLASTKNKYGWGSTHDLLLQSISIVR